MTMGTVIPFPSAATSVPVKVSVGSDLTQGTVILATSDSEKAQVLSLSPDAAVDLIVALTRTLAVVVNA